MAKIPNIAKRLRASATSIKSANKPITFTRGSSRWSNPLALAISSADRARSILRPRLRSVRAMNLPLRLRLCLSLVRVSLTGNWFEIVFTSACTLIYLLSHPNSKPGHSSSHDPSEQDEDRDDQASADHRRH